MKIELSKIKLDPHQPRKIVDHQSVENLAKSMKVEGLIHPIEVDKDYMIIVGEMRYRAAKSLGWKEIAANVHKADITPYERLRRQMAENLQQSGAKGGGQPMNAIDTAKAWAKLYELKTGKGYTPGEHPFFEKQTAGGEQMIGVFLTIAEEVGVPKVTVWEHLKLLEQPKYVIEDLTKGRPRTFYREAERLPKEIKGIEVREPIKKAISEGKIENREDIRRLARTLRYKPEKVEVEMLRIMDKQSEDANKVLNTAMELQVALDTATPDEWTKADRVMAGKALGSVSGTIRNFVGKLNKVP